MVHTHGMGAAPNGIVSDLQIYYSGFHSCIILIIS